MSRIKLFCIPYAGGSAMVYSKWKKSLAEFIELRELELPGRGRRFSDPYCNSVEEVVEDILSRIKDELVDGSKFAFFGHSMGTLIVYELTSRIKELYNNSPVHVFFSGRNSPDKKVESKVVHTLHDDEFKYELNKFGGIPQKVFENSELAKVFIPILRADYKLIDTYNYNKVKNKLDSNITILYGTDDSYIKYDIESWKEFTTKQCEIIPYQGGHFFISDYMKEVIEVINETLAAY